MTVAGTWTDPAGSTDNPYSWWWDLDGDGMPNTSDTASFGDTIERSTMFAIEGLYALTFGVTDKDGDTGTDAMVVEVLNRPPDCSMAVPSIGSIWPANHRVVPVEVLDIRDLEGDATSIAITSIRQDELVDSTGNGSSTPDGSGIGISMAEVRAERDGSGNGRFYHIFFTADDGHGGTCSGEVLVGVPKNQGKNGAPVDGGALYDSAVP